MNTQIYINLPVADLTRSRSFFTALGFAINEQFSDDTAACVIISEHIYVMLLTYPKFRKFTSKDICDTSKAVEVLNCLSCDSRDEVDALVRKAVAAGGSKYAEPIDHGFMYQHSFLDVDGHSWELVHMEPGATCQS